jgi:hypothetical protein
MTNNFTMENLFQWVVNEHVWLSISHLKKNISLFQRKPNVGWIVPKNHYYSRSPSIDKATLYDSLADYDNLLVFLTSNKLDELKVRIIMNLPPLVVGSR